MHKKQLLGVGVPAIAAVLVLGGCTAKNNVTTTPTTSVTPPTEVVDDQMMDDVTATAQVPATQAAKDAVEWAGTYKGTLPCASCEGIDTEITLKEDGTYVEKTTYITTKPGGGEADTDTGTIAWDATGTKVTLTESDDDGDVDDDDQSMYLVAEGQLRALDMSGNVIDGPLAEKYILKKQ